MILTQTPCAAERSVRVRPRSTEQPGKHATCTHKSAVTGHLLLVLLGGSVLVTSVLAQPETPPHALSVPVDVSKEFSPSGFMGDGEKGSRNVNVQLVSDEHCRPNGDDRRCLKVSYSPGAIGWAGVYWLRGDGNWGDRAGVGIRNATKLVFWAAGDRGGEFIEFKSGGVTGKLYRDTFEVSTGTRALTREWKRYELDVKGQKLSNVVGAFAWVATASANPGGVTFYLDGIRFE